MASEMAHYDDRYERDAMEAREQAMDKTIAKVKAGYFDEIVQVAYHHNNYVTVMDARVLDALLTTIKTKL
jgi:hypothetical protein